MVVLSSADGMVGLMLATRVLLGEVLNENPPAGEVRESVVPAVFISDDAVLPGEKS